METDNQTLETTSDQVVCTSDDHDHQVLSPARSYECTFCKRGFSTAQALGGHMNIHRKDKAKLRKASNEAQQYSFDIAKPASLFSPITTNAKDLSQAMCTEERSKTPWPNWINVSGEDDTITRADQSLVGEPQKLLSSFLRDHDHKRSSQDIGTDKAVKGLPIYGHGSSGADQLDLELRLGPEPHGPSKATAGTKRFF